MGRDRSEQQRRRQHRKAKNQTSGGGHETAGTSVNIAGGKKTFERPLTYARAKRGESVRHICGSREKAEKV
jgi:hypothetical protein